MTEHLPECWSTYPSDPPAWCICDELLACEKRVLGEGIQKLLIAEGVRGFIEYGKSRWNKGYEMGYAVAKVKYKKRRRIDE
jgi:hypothetical protein